MKVLFIAKMKGGIREHVLALRSNLGCKSATLSYSSGGNYCVPTINIPLLRALSFFLLGIPCGLRTIRKEKPDVIHSHYILPAGLLGSVLSRLTGTRHVITVHGSDVVKLPSLNWLKRAACRKAKVIAVSHYLQSELEKIGIASKVIPGGVDLQKIRSAKPKKLKRPAILFVGSLVPEKVGFLQEVISSTPATFYIVGSGRLASKIGGRHLGTLPHPRLYSYYRSVDCLISTSEWEGFGLAVLEAMAAGCPVVARPNGSLRQLVGGRGLLASTPGGFRLAIAKLLKDRKLKENLSRKGKVFASKFTWKKIADDVEKVYIG